MKDSFRLAFNHRVASTTNFLVLVAVLFCFPLVLRWTGALSVAQISPQSPQHTQSFLRFCLVLIDLGIACATLLAMAFSPPHVNAEQEALWYRVYAVALWITVFIIATIFGKQLERRSA